MKELSIEEKAKAYDEAIKALRSLFAEQAIKHCDRVYIKDITNIFPEFVEESEGERIRKDMMETIKKESEDFPSSVIAEKSHTWLAWLEKQGEHKSIEYPLCKTVKDKIDYYIVNHFTTDTVVKTDVNSIVKAMKEGVMIGMSEQKSAGWNIFDFRTWQYIVSDVLTKKDGIGQYLDSGECKKIAQYMQEEWSKKLSVEKMPELLKGEDYGINGLYAAVDILQKTLGKVDGYQTDDGILSHKCAISAVNELSKQKSTWSEEDEDKMQIIINIIKDSDPDWEELINWLKSLRPQSHWKPSDEQMKMLDEVLSFAANHESPYWNDCIFGILNNLIKQLKILRKEYV